MFHKNKNKLILIAIFLLIYLTTLALPYLKQAHTQKEIISLPRHHCLNCHHLHHFHQNSFLLYAVLKVASIRTFLTF